MTEQKTPANFGPVEDHTIPPFGKLFEGINAAIKKIGERAHSSIRPFQAADIHTPAPISEQVAPVIENTAKTISQSEEAIKAAQLNQKIIMKYVCDVVEQNPDNPNITRDLRQRCQETQR